MKDFTLDAYRLYLEAIKTAYEPILRFDEYFRLPRKPVSFALIRHDIDRRPLKALRMAQLENQMGIRSSYYFRVKPHVFKPSIIRAIQRLGHEIGYHYETLSDARGDHLLAMQQFGRHLKRLRSIANIHTICMHGRPFSPHNNLDLCRNTETRSKICTAQKILCELYLDIDYDDMAYLCDTGRKWDQHLAIIRDRVNSHVAVSLKLGKELLQALLDKLWILFVFQVHPELWSENEAEFFAQYVIDAWINLGKKLL